MEEIIKNLKTDKLLLGAKSTVKALRKSNVQKIFLASNCPDMLVEVIEHLAAFENVEVETLNVACDELGIVCKKPFLVSVVSILK